MARTEALLNRISLLLDGCAIVERNNPVAAPMLYSLTQFIHFRSSPK